jgi:hypothetical protein
MSGRAGRLDGGWLGGRYGAWFGEQVHKSVGIYEVIPPLSEQ